MGKKIWHNRSNRISFSASLPEDVCGELAGSIGIVKLSVDPFSELKASIVEMIEELDVRDWNAMEELVYCYIVLNSSSQVHHIIKDAFVSLCDSFLYKIV
ncbi:conserved hypothetical protein [Ricinus communis]|uniref:Transcription repressor n=1 Tax=Ricinus communis TaxID=3988 RepID=B9S0T4_RICCO|nr:conserved hypothetical protein [Ricinus communis]